MLAVAMLAVLSQALWDSAPGSDGDEVLEAVCETAAGSFILAGHTTPAGTGEPDGWVVELRGDGRFQWDRSFGGPGADRLRAAAAIPGGGVVLAGETVPEGGGDPDLWLLRLDEDGGEVWSRSYGGAFEEAASSVLVLEDGSILVSGHTWSEGSGGSDALLLKVDSAGEVQWSRTFGGLGQEKGLCLIALPGGGFAVAGLTFSFESVSGDAYLVGVDDWGMERWSRYLGGSSYDYCMDLAVTPAGGLAAACWSRRTSCALWLTEFTQGGAPVSERLYETSHDLRVESLEEMPGGLLALAGTSGDLSAGSRSIFAWLVDPSFDLVWSASTGGESDEVCRDMAVTSAGCLLAVGSRSSGEGDTDGYAVCFSPGIN